MDEQEVVSQENKSQQIVSQQIVPQETVVSQENEKDYFSILPNEVLIHIFSMVDWDNLRNLNILCQRFRNIVKKNDKKMDKPVLESIYITTKKIDEIHLFDLQINYLKKSENPYSIGYYDKLNIAKYEIKPILNKFKLNHLQLLSLNVDSSVKMFKLLNKCFENGTSLETLETGILNERDLQNFKSFINKLVSLKHIDIRHLCINTLSQNKFTFLGLNAISTLRSVSFGECRSSNMIGRTMMLSLYDCNPFLRFLNIYTDNKKFYRNVFYDFVFRHEILEHTICNHSKIHLQLHTFPEIFKLEDIFNFLTLHSDEIDDISMYQVGDGESGYTFEKICPICRENWIKMQISLDSTLYHYH